MRCYATTARLEPLPDHKPAAPVSGRKTTLPLAMHQFRSSSRVDRLVRVRAQILPRTLIPFAIFVQRAQLGQETEQIVQPATRPVHRRRDEPAFVESSPLAVSV
jgi:hypothetical protein